MEHKESIILKLFEFSMYSLTLFGSLGKLYNAAVDAGIFDDYLTSIDRLEALAKAKICISISMSENFNYLLMYYILGEVRSVYYSNLVHKFYKFILHYVCEQIDDAFDDVNYTEFGKSHLTSFAQSLELPTWEDYTLYFNTFFKEFGLGVEDSNKNIEKASIEKSRDSKQEEALNRVLAHLRSGGGTK